MNRHLPEPTACCLLACCVLAPAAWANPQGLTIGAGSASTAVAGGTLTVTAGNNAILDWKSFNIGAGETTIFRQPDPAAIVWNRINDQARTEILGNLQANGTVVLFNQSGFYFGPDSVVTAAGFVATTAVPPPNLGEGALWSFSGMPPAASIVNYGSIQVGTGGALFLVAEKIENHGILTAPDGTLGLYAGKEVLLSERPDGRGLSAQVRLPAGAITSDGQLSAGAGEIAVHAQVVNLGGSLQATGVAAHDGIIELVAGQDLTLAPGTTITAAAAPIPADSAPSDAGGTVRLEAGRNVVFANSSSAARVQAGTGWDVSVKAGGSVQLGGGPIGGTGTSPQGAGAIETANGSLHVEAHQDVLVGAGFLRTTAGGEVTVTATTGDIRTGSKADTYQFTPAGYAVGRDGVGGISTSGGGNVTLAAGRDVIAEQGAKGGVPGASGAFGAAAGDVTVTAGRDVRGTFNLAHGAGTIHAGRDAGSASNPLSLQLIAGLWDVRADGDINLNEVRNPNGTFNANRLTAPDGQRSTYLFDYATDAGLRLDAGNSVTFLGQNLPRTAGNRGLKPTLPGRLEVHAGAGGIEFRNTFVLAPSAQGQLVLETTDGGSLRGIAQDQVTPRLVMSDSASLRYDTFLSDHSDPPLHLHDLETSRVHISGDIQNLTLSLAEAVSVKVDGGTYNFGLEAQNLRPTDVTSLNVAGDILYRGNRTTVTLAEDPNLALLSADSDANPIVFSKLVYNPKTRELSWLGLMNDQELAYLLNPLLRHIDPLTETYAVDAFDNVLYDLPGTLTRDTAALQQLFEDSKTATLSGATLSVGGLGRFLVNARGIDLGISDGIISAAPTPALARLGGRGPDVFVDVAHDLVMTSSKIAALGDGGDLTLTVGGHIDVGSVDSLLADRATGIFTFAGGSIGITAIQDINVNGSRIATYNGGAINVHSLTGNIDAGNGGLGSVSVNRFTTSDTGELVQSTTTIPGSGILAISLPGSTVAPGDVSLKADTGSIRASKGGVLQLALNDTRQVPAIRVEAGGDIDAGQSGFIGGDIVAVAKGEIRGLFVGTGNVDIRTDTTFSGTAFGGGNVSVDAGKSVSGTVIAGGEAKVSAEAVSGAIVGTTTSTSGDASGATVGVQSTQTARSDSKVDAAADDSLTRKTTATTEESEDEKKKRLATGPKLMRTVGRVTVLLPPRVN